MRNSGGHREKYRTLPTHNERMIERRAGQNLRIGYTRRNPEVIARVEQFSAYMRELNRKNGVGSPKARLKFLELEAA
jgi:hypothetical protein